MKVYVVDVEAKPAVSALETIIRNAHPGAVIYLTQEEFKALRTSVVEMEVEDKCSATD